MCRPPLLGPRFQNGSHAPAVNPIKTRKMLLFGMNTGLIDFVGGNSIIPCKLDMCEWPMDSSTLENDNVLTDALGVIRSVSNITAPLTGIKKLEMTILTNSMAEASIILWGIKTTIFSLEYQFHGGKNVVLIVAGLVLRQKNGKVYLSSTATTTFNFNPKCAHAMHLSSKVADAVGEFICDVPSETPIQIRGTGNADQLYNSLNELVTETLWAHQKATDPGARKGWRHSSQTIDHGKGPKATYRNARQRLHQILLDGQGRLRCSNTVEKD
ncbi:hypothetical protein ACET3Z_031812 [Daucus carota]